MSRTQITSFILFGVILVAFFLRFWQLGQNPPSLTWDEVAWGYNAYSLGLNGRDEFGRFLPITYLESFGDFKPPLYAYLGILPVKIFGLNEFAVRFPSAFLGTLTVLLTYYLTKVIFSRNPKFEILNPKQVPNSNSKYSKQFEIGNPPAGEAGWRLEILALLSAFILAISPWHILLSRAAFEANVATFFIVLGVFLFLIATSRGVLPKTPPRWILIDASGVFLLLSILSFVLSMYAFNTARIVVPLLLLGLTIGRRKELLSIKKQTVVAGLVGGIVFLPLFIFLTTPQARLRFREVSIFSDIGVIKRTNQQATNDNNALWSRIIHNRRAAFTVEYLKHYFDNLNPQFLFIRGDGNPKFSIQDVGQMYLWEVPFFIAGALLLFRKKERNWWIIPYWLLVGIAPAATARETPHALRIESALPTFQILTAIGITEFILWIRRNNMVYHFKFFIFIFIFSFSFFNFLYFYHEYFTHYPREFSGEWQYGYKEAIFYISSVENKYDQVLFTEELGRPYIYFLFHKKYNPRNFREEASIDREVFGFVHVRGFGKYRFAKDLGLFYTSRNSLFVDIPSKVPANARVQKTFNLLNGEKALVAYTL